VFSESESKISERINPTRMIKFLFMLAIGASVAYPIPLEYQHGNNTVKVNVVEPYQIKNYCGDAGPKWTILACAKGNTINMPNPCEYPEAKDIDSYAHLTVPRVSSHEWLGSRLIRLAVADFKAIRRTRQRNRRRCFGRWGNTV
jgi:hypothetical protein